MGLPAGPEHRQGADGLQREFRRDVRGDADQADDLDVKHFAGGPRRLKFDHPELEQADLERVPVDRARYLLRLAVQLVADRRPDEVGPVREEAFLDQQIDPSKIDIAKVDRNLLAVGNAPPQLHHFFRHRLFSIRVDGIWKAYGRIQEWWRFAR